MAVQEGAGLNVVEVGKREYPKEIEALIGQEPDEDQGTQSRGDRTAPSEAPSDAGGAARLLREVGSRGGASLEEVHQRLDTRGDPSSHRRATVLGPSELPFAMRTAPPTFSATAAGPLVSVSTGPPPRDFTDDTGPADTPTGLRRFTSSSHQ